ncbi:helix-turn-helix domain-containing protein [Herbiconiux sp. KACC 21604]|uniref:AraC family transcriptional regulator n=1 Tax=unclassified Herbiconiux TaxID=2618217 RepID=UPI001492A4C6|nr:helix-turn-helix domain-containing protein [Herbiconiux sp. SALV-R1]QJU54897.1 AraC family transcriptional regulator [Herbiconiux sp. SALV-R1]WPO86021.1 helix-turn-helix domain-containing protein [Herbiconiux sp. KACC 21604]
MSGPTSKGHLNPGDAGVAFDRFELGPGLGELVRHVWVVHWNLPAGETRPQRVLSYPAFNVVVQREGAVLAGPDPRVSVTELRGSGWGVGVLFRPAAGPLLATRPPRELVGKIEPFPDAPTARITTLLERGGSRHDLVAALRHWLGPLAASVDESGMLVNRVARAAERDRDVVRASDLADRAGVGLRTLERLTREFIGVTPKWLIECRRLQEAATRLHAHPSTALSPLAAELGYADYAHFARRYTAIVGESPRATARAAGGG